jgi:hypothetical protein|uniref:Uncharacterized protein n=1 Tax=Siphoviridae sp. ct7yc1 TaxID=2827788 RepID=A0A8S5TJG1_9CAUD|nr:MAG TPA: hypothetical protein [Siphoviridae sp. ct7yc1]
MNFNELFVDKSKTLIINTDLALVLGDLNEAIVLNQLNYWLGINRKVGKNFIDDRYWVYNSYSDWKAKDFPYWSEKTIQRTFTRLENKGVVVSANYNKLGIDKTKWYTIDTEKLQELVDEFNSDEDKMTNRQDNMTDRQDKMTCREGQCDRPLPEITTENINRDYNSEITGEVHTSVSEKQTARVTRQDMQAKKDDMVYRFSEICDNSIENKTVGEAVKNAFCRYMNLYETYFCKVHPILTDKALTNVCLSLSNVTDTEHNHFEWTDVYLADETGLTGLDRMVNEHFRRTHRRETNYSITHFAKSDYLLQLAQGIIEY